MKLQGREHRNDLTFCVSNESFSLTWSSKAEREVFLTMEEGRDS